MIGLFLLFIIVLALVYFRKRKWALLLGILNLILCLAMLMHHATSKLDIVL